MTALSIEQALEQIYTSLKNDNEDIDLHIATLKSAMGAAGQKTVAVETSKLAQQNRAGRKMMQSYFKKRGVSVTFSDTE